MADMVEVRAVVRLEMLERVVRCLKESGVPRLTVGGKLLFAGEAAGFQDALWGFGMRYAMVSGSLAARCVVAGRHEDYDRRWRERLGGLLRTGIVNRWVYGMLGDRGYRALARSLDRAGDARAWARRLYRPSLPKGILYPAARRLVRSSRRERLCAVEECDCTWCRCRREATGVGAGGPAAPVTAAGRAG